MIDVDDIYWDFIFVVKYLNANLVDGYKTLLECNVKGW